MFMRYSFEVSASLLQSLWALDVVMKEKCNHRNQESVSDRRPTILSVNEVEFHLMWVNYFLCERRKFRLILLTV